MSRRSFIILTSLTILLISVPYVLAHYSAGTDLVFTGFLQNPMDGKSYLGKMREGWMGSWQFTMLASSVPARGSLVNLYYLFLGHISRWTGLSLILTFHFIRILGAVFFCVVLRKFIDEYLESVNPKVKVIAFALVVLGSGSGWLAAFFGGFTSDFWVAEAYPFLSMYSSPHFIIGLALLLDFFRNAGKPLKSPSIPGMVLKGLLLGLVFPFAMVIAGVVAISLQIWDIIGGVQPIRWWMLSFLIPGGLVLIYQYAVIQSDPILSAWNSQNLTLSPPFWDFLVSFTPAIVLALLGIIYLARNTIVFRSRLLIVWIIAGAILAYFPFQLQRRFLLGLFIPIACLAAIMLAWLLDRKAIVYRMAAWVLLIGSFLTNILILFGGINAIVSQSSEIYYPKTLQSAFTWMLDHPNKDGVVLSLPKTGLLIPGASGWRVLIGHPFETPNYSSLSTEVERLFSVSTTQSDFDAFLNRYGINTLFIGPDERSKLNDPPWLAAYRIVYQNPQVVIYSTAPE